MADSLEQAAMKALEAMEGAPANSLPPWDECAMRVDNSEYIAKRVAEGGYGPDADSKLASELHRFIYEYDDADPYRSAWFLHRLELLLNETREQARSALHQEAGEAGPVAWMTNEPNTSPVVTAEFLRRHPEYRNIYPAPLYLHASTSGDGKALTGDMRNRPEAATKALNECAAAFIDCTLHSQDALALVRYVLELEAALRKSTAAIATRQGTK